MKKIVIDWTCGSQQMHTGFWWGKLLEHDHSEGCEGNGRIILRWIFEK
jgi:hypothetical protein